METPLDSNCAPNWRPSAVIKFSSVLDLLTQIFELIRSAVKLFSLSLLLSRFI